MFKVRSVLSLILWLTCTCSTAYAGESVRNPPADSIAMAARIDSVRQLRANDVAFILDKIETAYVSGRRGISDSIWQQTSDFIERMLLNDLISGHDREFAFMLRNIGRLTADAHFAFPDGGALNRFRFFRERGPNIPAVGSGMERRHGVQRQGLFGDNSSGCSDRIGQQRVLPTVRFQ